jgi:hypothetical protein
MSSGPTASASSMISNLGSAVQSSWPSYLAIGLLLATTGLYIAALVQMSSFLGSTDNWNDIKPQLSPILGEIIAGSIIATIAAILFFTQSPVFAQSFAIGSSMFAIGMSFAAVSIATMTR